MQLGRYNMNYVKLEELERGICQRAGDREGYEEEDLHRGQADPNTAGGARVVCSHLRSHLPVQITEEVYLEREGEES